MKKMKKTSLFNKLLIICLVFCFSIFTACKKTPEPPPTPAILFYHWKTIFQPTQLEAATLAKLNTPRLYVRLFDVAYGQDNSITPLVPLATTAFRSPPPLPVVGVVYIDNASLLRDLENINLSDLAERIVTRSFAIMRENKLQEAGELQIDCDWTPSSRDTFFSLLQRIKNRLPENYTLSVTLRLHQYKNPDQAGVPPAHKATLMVYNMGSLRNFGKENSIIDRQVASSYLKTAQKYPLPLNVALPLFSWSVLFDKEMNYQGLIRQLPKNLAEKTIWTEIDAGLYQLVQAQVIDGRTIPKGWYLRAETVQKDVLEDVAKLLGQTVAPVDTVIFYHLDEKTLKDWSVNELKEIASLVR